MEDAGWPGERQRPLSTTYRLCTWEWTGESTGESTGEPGRLRRHCVVFCVGVSPVFMRLDKKYRFQILATDYYSRTAQETRDITKSFLRLQRLARRWLHLRRCLRRLATPRRILKRELGTELPFHLQLEQAVREQPARHPRTSMPQGAPLPLCEQ